MASEVTNRDLYEAIGELRGEVNTSIQRLDDKFMQLEAGRLTRAEGNISELRVELQKAITDITGSISTVKTTSRTAEATISTKFLVIQAIVYVLFFAFIDGLARKFIK